MVVIKQPVVYKLLLVLLATATVLPARAAELTAIMNKTTPDGTADALGTITIASSDTGATFALALHGLPPGPHGFHVHENGSCNPTMLNNVAIPGGAAGGHMDTGHTGKHQGPTGEGHVGDLPVLEAQANGTADQILTAPRIKDIAALRGHALVIHLGGDNYADTPAPLGGGGARFACGVVE